MNTIDFRVTGWGHNHYFEPLEDGTYYGACWSTPIVQVGDTVIWETNYGHAEAEVLESEPPVFPVADMRIVRSRVVKRVANPDIVSQEEVDEHFKTNDR